MPLIVTCPGCGRKLTVPERALGRAGRCPACKARFVARASGSTPLPPPPQAQKAAPPTGVGACTTTSRQESSGAEEFRRLVAIPPANRVRAAARGRPVPRRHHPTGGKDEPLPARRKPVALKRSKKGWLLGLLLAAAALLAIGIFEGIRFFRRPAASAPTIADADWQLFRPPNGACAVLMPGAPTCSTEETETTTINQYVVERAGGDLVFMLSFWDVSPAALQPEFLDDVTAAECGNRSRILQEKELNPEVAGTRRIALAAYEGREFQIRYTGSRLLITRHYLARVGPGARLYAVMIAGPSIQPDQGMAARFLESFTIDPPPPAEPAPTPQVSAGLSSEAAPKPSSPPAPAPAPTPSPPPAPPRKPSPPPRQAPKPSPPHQAPKPSATLPGSARNRPAVLPAAHPRPRK